MGIIAKDQVNLVREDLNKMKSQFEAALPEHVTPEKFVRVCLTAIQGSPDLLGCDRQSLLASAVKCAADGLLPDGREAAFVKYGNKVQYLPMIGGIYKKLRNSSEIASLTSQIIYKNDKFRYWVDSDGEHLEHEPLLFGGDRGGAVGVYAIAKMKNGGTEIEPMSKEEVMAVKGASRSGNSGPWAGPFENEMWRKTAIRRLSKRLPMSTELQRVIEADDDMYDLKKANAGRTSEILSLIQSSDAGSESVESPETEVESIVEKAIEAPKVKSSDPDSFDNFPNGPVK